MRPTDDEGQVAAGAARARRRRPKGCSEPATKTTLLRLSIRTACQGRSGDGHPGRV